MAELMIIADDFTGALDAGVHFAERGIRTRVIVSLEDDRSWEEGIESKETTVLVVDAETRHVSSDQAYRKVSAVVQDARKAGIPYIYKKTDSALRGNIGSELEAAYRAAGEQFLGFIPALPQMNRITRGGRQYIDGVPVSQSVFGRDPFEPVTKDSVKDIIRLQSEIPVAEVFAAGRPDQERIDQGQLDQGRLDQERIDQGQPDQKQAAPQRPTPQQTGIVVYDAETEEDIRRIGEELAASGRSRLLAGCAGFAAILPDLLGLKCREPEEAALEPKLFVICGSVNPITRRQLDWGERAGYPRSYMSVREKLDLEFWKSEQGNELIRRLTRESRENDCVILDTNDREGEQDTLEYARGLGMDTEQVRGRIPETLGIILKNMLDNGLQAVILVTGGDTLLGFMKEIRQWELQPIRQIRPGCVLTKLHYGGREYHIITKSGGFGEENLLPELTEELKGK